MNEITHEPPAPPNAPLDVRPLTLANDPEPTSDLLVLVAGVLGYLLGPSIILLGLNSIHFFAWYYNPARFGVELSRTAIDQRQNQFWVPALAFPVQLVVIVGVVVVFRRSRPADLLPRREVLFRNVRLGSVAALLITPVVLSIHFGIVWLHQRVFHLAPQDHPLALLGRQSLTPLEWTLWLFVAIVAAPVLEEWLFRGLFQSYAVGNAEGPLAALVLATLLTLLSRTDQLSDAARRLGAEGWAASSYAVADAAAPLIFLALMAGVLVLLPRAGAAGERSTGPQPTRALFATALLFAMVHTRVWPSPVALLLLALALGWLRQRTGSLVTPIVLHGLFNGTSCAMLLLGWA